MIKHHIGYLGNILVASGKIIFVAVILLNLMSSCLDAGLAKESSATVSRSSKDNTIVIIPIDPGSVKGIEAMLRQTRNEKVSGVIHNSGKALPELVLMGSDPAEVEKTRKLIMMALASIGTKSHTIVVSTKLLELSDTDMKAIGHSLIPSAKGTITNKFSRDYIKRLSTGSLGVSL